MTDEPVNWVRTGGGPLVLIEEDLLPKWLGTNGSVFDSGPTAKTDYDRACAGNQWMRLLPIEEGRVAIVFGGSSLEMTWLPLALPTAGLLAGVEYGPSDNEILQAIDEIPASSFRRTDTTISTNYPRLWLFDSAYAGSEVSGTSSQVIDLPPGEYWIDFAEKWDPDSMGLILHRLTRMP